MTDVTRRGFVKSSAGAAAGATVLGALLAERADAEVREAESQPVVAYVRDARRGEVSVLAADRQVTVRDPKLAAQIVRAAR